MILNIGKDFSSDPAGRFYTDGPSSGEFFREEYLRPALAGLAQGEVLEIILDDGVEGYGSSFLSEGFAGIVKYGYMPADQFLSLIRLKNTDPDFDFYKKKIVEHINSAKFRSKNYVKSA
jgi:hypothetical protein